MTDNNKQNIVEIMNIPFLNESKDTFLRAKIKPRLLNREKCFVVTANPEIVMETRKNPDYKEAVLSADYVVPDGTGILFAAKYKKQPLTERIAGFDLMRDMLEMANEEAATCFFLGASEDVNKKAVEKVEQDYPNIVMAGRHHGFFNGDEEKVSAVIRESRADFIFVALGLPRQEIWIKNNIDFFKKGIFIGVGGSFDVLAGTVKRAPNFWIKLHLEWLYRLLRQPFRWKRMIPIVKFIGLVLFKRAS